MTRQPRRRRVWAWRPACRIAPAPDAAGCDPSSPLLPIGLSAMPVAPACPVVPTAAERRRLKKMAYGHKSEHRLRVGAQVVLHAMSAARTWRGTHRAALSRPTGGTALPVTVSRLEGHEGPGPGGVPRATGATVPGWRHETFLHVVGVIQPRPAGGPGPGR